MGRLVNGTSLLSVIVDVITNTDAPRSDLPDDADGAIRQLYFDHAEALLSYERRFCLDQPGADDIVQETFIRAWRHLPRLRADGRPIRPWLFRVARNLLSDADRALRAHGGTTAVFARRLGIPHGTARSRLHYALHALRAHLQDQYAAACP